MHEQMNLGITLPLHDNLSCQIRSELSFLADFYTGWEFEIHTDVLQHLYYDCVERDLLDRALRNLAKFPVKCRIRPRHKNV